MISTITTYLCAVSTMLTTPVENLYTIEITDPIVCKGPTTITFILSNISEYPFKISRLKFNYDDKDNTPTIIQESRSLKPLSSNILVPKSNTYYPSIKSYYTRSVAEFYFYRECGDIILIKQPITVAQASIYDDIDNIMISNSQLIDKQSNFNLLNITGDKTPYTLVGVLSDGA